MNPSFEDGGNNWSFYSGARSASIGVVNNANYANASNTGNNALKIQCNRVGTDLSATNIMPSLCPGATYNVTFWAKSAVNWSQYNTMGLLTGGGNMVRLGPMSSDGLYQKYSGLVTYYGSTPSVYFSLECTYDNLYTLYVDDFSISEA